jgi:hypothetical protein
MGGSCNMHGKINAYMSAVEMPEGKRPLGRYRRRWEDNIKFDLKQGVSVWAGLIWLRTESIGGLVNTVMNILLYKRQGISLS